MKELISLNIIFINKIIVLHDKRILCASSIDRQISIYRIENNNFELDIYQGDLYLRDIL